MKHVINENHAISNDKPTIYVGVIADGILRQINWVWFEALLTENLEELRSLVANVGQTNLDSDLDIDIEDISHLSALGTIETFNISEAKSTDLEFKFDESKWLQRKLKHFAQKYQLPDFVIADFYRDYGSIINSKAIHLNLFDELLKSKNDNYNYVFTLIFWMDNLPIMSDYIFVREDKYVRNGHFYDFIYEMNDVEYFKKFNIIICADEEIVKDLTPHNIKVRAINTNQ